MRIPSPIGIIVPWFVEDTLLCTLVKQTAKGRKSMMVFNGALLLEFAGWALEFCQVLACNPEVLGRSEVWDMLCCVPLHLLARAFRLLFSAFRVRLLPPPPPLLPHND